MGRLFTRVCVAALLLGASGCLAAFRVGSPQPDIVIPPGQSVPASIGIDVNIRADASDEALGHAEAWKQKVWEGAEQSGAFGAVHRSARPDELRAEIDAHLERLGHASLADWAGVANLEERVDGEDEIDPVVLAELRRRR